MKSKQKSIGLLLVCLCAALLLSACAKLPKLEFKDGAYRDTASNVVYYAAPLYYEAVSYTDKAVSRIPQKNQEDILLYPIAGLSESQYLCDADYGIYYAEGVTLPALWDMDVQKIEVCTPSVLTSVNATITDAANIVANIAAYKNGTAVPAGKLDSSVSCTTYELKFTSNTLPGIYFCLFFRLYDGDAVVYEKVADKDNFTPTYAGVEVTFEDYYYGEGNTEVEHMAVYHFGNGLIYDMETGLCYSADPSLAAALKENA